MDDSAVSSGTPANRARGRGKSRGGLGKYLRARGRGRGGGRPAQFGTRLLLEGEEQVEVDEQEQQELEHKYARRRLGTNADRYVEPEPDIDFESEEVLEPEVDISAFLERQRLSPQSSSAPSPPDEDEDVDKSLAHIAPHAQGPSQSRKGKVQQIEWDTSLEEMSRQKAAAEAKWELKNRFRAQTTQQRARDNARGTFTSRGKTFKDRRMEAPPLPTDTPKAHKPEKEGMQDFLDDLIG